MANIIKITRQANNSIIYDYNGSITQLPSFTVACYTDLAGYVMLATGNTQTDKKFSVTELKEINGVAKTYALNQLNQAITDLSTNVFLNELTAEIDTTGLATAENQTMGNNLLMDIENNTDGIETKLDILNGKDFATQKTLNTLTNKDFATQTTLASIKDTDGIKKITDTVTITGTVTANAGTNLNTSSLATSANQTNGGQKTQIVDLDGHIVNIQQIAAATTGDEYGALTISMIHGKTTGGGGGWVDVKVSPSGSLTVDCNGDLLTNIEANQTNGTQLSNIKIYDENTATYKGLKFTDGQPRVINTDYLKAIGEGEITGHELYNKISANINNNIVNVEQDIWEVGGLYTFPAPAGIQMEIVSTSANDAAAGTGIRTVTIIYLDNTFAEKTETITLNGLTAVNTVATNIRRINSLRSATSGTGLVAAGNITLRAVGGGTSYARISTGYNASRQSIYTVPLGKTLYMTSISFTAGTTAVNAFVRITSRSNYCNITNTILQEGLYMPYTEALLSNGSTYLRELEVPTKIIATADFKVSAIGSGAASNYNVTTMYRGWIE